MAKIYTIPNIITFIRIFLIPIILYLLFSENPNIVLIAGLLFIVSSVPDYFDGYLARILNHQSAMGRLFDPIADKLLVGACLLVLCSFGYISGLTVLPALIILLREILVSGLREYLAEIRVGLPVSRLAKWKTGLQMFSLGFLIVGDASPSEIPSVFIGEICLWLAALLTLWTGYDYLRSGLLHASAGDSDSVDD